MIQFPGGFDLGTILRMWTINFGQFYDCHALLSRLYFDVYIFRLLNLY